MSRYRTVEEQEQPIPRRATYVQPNDQRERKTTQLPVKEQKKSH